MGHVLLIVPYIFYAPRPHKHTYIFERPQDILFTFHLFSLLLFIDTLLVRLSAIWRVQHPDATLLQNLLRLVALFGLAFGSFQATT